MSAKTKQLTGNSAIGHDITSRIAPEGQRVTLDTGPDRSERLEGMGRLAGVVAHDVNDLVAAHRGCRSGVCSSSEHAPVTTRRLGNRTSVY